MVGKGQSDGLRLNNPGLIQKADGEVLGLAEKQPSGELVAFDKATQGIRSLAAALLRLQGSAGRMLLGELLGRWASRHGEGAAGFAAEVAALADMALDQRVDVRDFRDLKPIVEALIRYQNGRQPYSSGQLTKGLLLAGVEPAKRPLDQSRTMRGGIIAVLLSLVVSALETVRDDPDRAQATVRLIAPKAEAWFLEALPHLESAQWVSQIFIFAALALVLWARLDDRRKGLR